jgi:hypothetical protein
VVILIVLLVLKVNMLLLSVLRSVLDALLEPTWIRASLLVGPVKWVLTPKGLMMAPTHVTHVMLVNIAPLLVVLLALYVQRVKVVVMV